MSRRDRGLSPPSPSSRSRSRSPLHRRDGHRIYDYLRLLFSSGPGSDCPSCGRRSAGQTTQIVDAVITAMGTARESSCVGADRPGPQGSIARKPWLSTDGSFSRGEWTEDEDPAEPIASSTSSESDIDVVVDRLKVSEEGRADGWPTQCWRCVSNCRGLAVRVVDGQGGTICNGKFACPDCGVSLPRGRPAPVLVQQPPTARAPSATGSGSTIYFDPDLVVPDGPGKTIRAGGDRPHGAAALESSLPPDARLPLSSHYRFSPPLLTCPVRKTLRLFVASSSSDPGRGAGQFALPKGRRTGNSPPSRSRVVMTTSAALPGDRPPRTCGIPLSRYMNNRPMPGVPRRRLKKEALCVTTVGKDGSDGVTGLPVGKRSPSRDLPLLAREEEIASPSASCTRSDAPPLPLDVGLGYLSLDRASRELFGRRGPADPTRNADRRRAWWASSTSSTSRRSACTSGTTPA